MKSQLNKIQDGYKHTALELICAILAVLLPITQPHAGDAVPTGTGKVTLLTLVSMRNFRVEQQKERSSFKVLVVTHWPSFHSW